MKRTMTLILSLALTIAVLAGCGANKEPVEATDAAEPGVQTVTNVDELLAAISPDTEIILEAGTYNLCDAADYGKESSSQYYTWQEVYDGFQLKLRSVKDLTIRGSGVESTVLSAEPRYADVLIFQNCSDITLEDFTAGHTIEPGECAGGVLSFEGSADINMNRLGLYGCGVTGVRTDICTNINISDSDIYECSSAGLLLNNTDIVTIDKCRLYDLGDPEYGGSAVFYMTGSNSVKITNCEVSNCTVQNLLNSSPCDGMEVSNTTFRDNRLRDAAFNLYGSGLVLDGNTFENNNIRSWYSAYSAEEGTAVDGNGEEITEEMLESMYTEPEEETTLPEQTVVHVGTVNELLAAIAPNTMIVLDAELYDFSTANGYGETTTEYYYWEDIYDGPGLVIAGVDNLTICSSDADVKAHTLAAVPRYANVLTFSQCSNITIQGFTAGHTEEPGYCTGGVLCFRDCDTVLVDNCGLFGCGTLGVEAEYSGDVTVTNCEIYECSYGGIRMWNVNGAAVADCTFRDLGGDSLMFSSCKNVTVDGKDVAGNYSEQ